MQTTLMFVWIGKESYYGMQEDLKSVFFTVLPVKTLRSAVQCEQEHLPGENGWRPPVHAFVHEDTHAANTEELMEKAQDLASPR